MTESDTDDFVDDMVYVKQDLRKTEFADTTFGSCDIDRNESANTNNLTKYDNEAHSSLAPFPSTMKFGSYEETSIDNFQYCDMSEATAFANTKFDSSYIDEYENLANLEKYGNEVSTMSSGSYEETSIVDIEYCDVASNFDRGEPSKTEFADTKFDFSDIDEWKNLDDLEKYGNEISTMVSGSYEEINIVDIEYCDVTSEFERGEPSKSQRTVMLEIDPYYSTEHQLEMDVSDGEDNVSDYIQHNQHETGTTIMLHIDPVEPGEWHSTVDLNDSQENANAWDQYMSELSGRRIVDIGSLFAQIKYIDRHSETCRFADMNFLHEIKRGLNSSFEFICASCGEYKRIEACPRNDHSLGTNESAVLGIRSVGLGKAHIDEFCAHLSVPSMSNTLYNSANKVQQDDWWYLAKKSASAALEKEIELAVLNNKVDSAGNAIMSIKVDGSWGKRSFGNNMSSLSGCAVIIGMQTRKIIYFDVRNKYCHVCKLAEVNKKEVREHVCNKNYSGPSTGMETDIIIAGFIECESRGARFDKYIADGDSNTYKVLQDIRIYEEPDMSVDKYYCVNHVRKNFRKKWRTLRGKTSYPYECREILTNAKCNDICRGVSMAAQHWRDSEVSMTEKIRNLETDVMNAPYHYFGRHENCNSYFCKKKDEEGEKEKQENLEMLQGCGLFDEVENACQHYFANNAKSLLADYTTNDNESFNNLICKRLDGKRINNYLGGTYKASVAESVVHYNSGYQSGSEYHNFKTGESSGIRKLEISRKRKCESNITKKKINPKKRKIAEPEAEQKKAYGANCQKADLEPDVYERAKQRFLEKLKIRQAQRTRIEAETKGPSNISYWTVIKRDLLTSAYFGRIVNNRNKSSFKNLLGLDILN